MVQSPRDVFLCIIIGTDQNAPTLQLRNGVEELGHLDSACPLATLNTRRSEMRTSAASSFAPACTANMLTVFALQMCSEMPEAIGLNQ